MSPRISSLYLRMVIRVLCNPKCVLKRRYLSNIRHHNSARELRSFDRLKGKTRKANKPALWSNTRRLWFQAWPNKYKLQQDIKQDQTRIKRPADTYKAPQKNKSKNCCNCHFVLAMWSSCCRFVSFLLWERFHEVSLTGKSGWHY